MTGHVFALAMAALDEVNGPEGQPPSQDARAEWDKIDWRAHEEQVQRLRQRIFKAAQEQDWPRVRNLQKLTAAEPVERSDERAAGDAAQYRAQDRRDRRGGRADSRSQGAGGGAGAPVHRLLESPRGQARVHPEGIKPCKTEAARNSRDHGPVSSEPG